jgi:hypothetical protein
VYFGAILGDGSKNYMDETSGVNSTSVLTRSCS